MHSDFKFVRPATSEFLRLRLIGTAASLSISAIAYGQTLPPPPVSPTPVTDYEYDAEGNPTKTTVDAATRSLITKQEYDSLGRRKKVTDAKNGYTHFGFDLQDRLTAVTDPRNLVTQYQPTGLGDVTSTVSPDTGTATSTFDAAGNLKTRTDARGVLATYTYDALNRATQVVYSRSGSASRTVSWTYDQAGGDFGSGVGRLTTAATPEVSTAFRYDAMGRVTKTSQRVNGGGARAVTYEYDVGPAKRPEPA